MERRDRLNDLKFYLKYRYFLRLPLYTESNGYDRFSPVHLLKEIDRQYIRYSSHTWEDFWLGCCSLWMEMEMETGMGGEYCD